MSRNQTQCLLIYQALLSGPKTPTELGAAGVNLVKLTARMADLRRWLQPDGKDWLNRDGRYELCLPQEG